MGAVATGLLLAAVVVIWPAPVQPLPLSVELKNPSAPPPRDAHTPVPDPEPVRFHFSHSAAPLEQSNRPLTEGLIVRPEIAGIWRWEHDDVLMFTPSKAWPVGGAYQVHLGPKLLAPQVRLESDTYRFYSESMNVRLAGEQFYQDPTDPMIKQVVATVRFNYPVDPNTLEQRIVVERYDAKGRTKRLRTTVTYDDLRFEAYVHSETLSIGLEDERARITVAKGVQAQAGGPGSDDPVSVDVRIPGRYGLFHIETSQITLVRNAKSEPEQVLLLHCSIGALEKNINEGLQVWLLPTTKPATQGRRAVQHYDWGNSDEIGPEALNAGRALAPVQIPAEHENTPDHSFRLDVPPGRALFVRLKRGVEAHGGYLLGKDYVAIVKVPAYPREVRVMHEGAVLSVSGDKRLSVMTRGVPAVKIELWRVFPEALNHLVSQTRGDFKSPYFVNYNFDQRNIAQVFSEVRSLDAADPRKAQYTAVDFGKHLEAAGGAHHGVFWLQITAWDPQANRPLSSEAQVYRRETDETNETGDDAPVEALGDGSGRADHRLVMLTDLGVVVKTTPKNEPRLFVQSFRSGDPVGDASVEILGRNGVPMLTRRTDATGSVEFPSLKGLADEQEPVAYVVHHGADTSFLPYKREDRRLNTSRFDVGGVQTGGEGGALDAYMFSDRGFYRPGETFHIGTLVKSADWARDVTGVPVEMHIANAHGVLVHRERVLLPASGFVELHYTPDESAPTGNYEVSTHLVKGALSERMLGSTSVTVQEFLPDRLRIAARVLDAPDEGWMAPEQVRAEVRLNNLFGTPAAGHTVITNMQLLPRFPAFSSYPDYRFYDPLRAEREYTEHLDDCITDTAGVCTLQPNLKNYAHASYELRLQVTGMELNGGRGVGGEAHVLVSPRSFLLGIHSEDDLSFVKRGAKRAVSVIAVNPKLQKVPAAGLFAVLVERRYVSVLARQGDGTYQYQSVLKDITRKRTALSVEAAGSMLRLPTDAPGTFVMSVRDAGDVELNQVQYTVAGEANLSRDLERNAELQMSLDKHDYAPGDTVSVNIRAPYTGAGLITIERDKVYAHKWFKTKTTGSVQTIVLPAGLEGNGYVNVTFVRSLDSHEIFMSPLSYGVAPFSVSRAARTVQVALQAPAQAQPGNTLPIVYSSSVPTKMVVYAVDAGILQVARYHTPDPLEHFLQKRALEVDTWQILDLLLPEYSLLRSISKSKEGGDDEADALKHNLNPFKRKHDKPVAYWSGILDADSTARTYSIQLPEAFNGSLKIMAVAVSPAALGTASTQSTVRGPFVLSPSAPLFATPGDVFDASVAVANEVPGVAKVKVALKVSDNLELLEEAEQEVPIPEHGEHAVHFKVRAKPQPGAGELLFSAQGGSAKASMHWSLSVRPASPFATSLQAGFVQNGMVTLPVPRQVYPLAAQRELAVSVLPVALAQGVETFLKTYPYRCTEQVVSGAAAAVAMRGMSGVARDERADAALLQTALGLLQARQNDAGAFGYWTASSNADPYVSVYVTHWLTEATEAGFVVPVDMRSRALEYVEKIAHGEAAMNNLRLRAYAIYVLARNGRLATADLAQVREKIARNQDKQESWRREVTPLFLAGAYALMRDTAEADKMIAQARWTPEATRPPAESYDDDQVLAAHALWIVAKHFPARLPQVQATALQSLANAATQNTYNTHSGALSIFALAAYSKALGADTQTDAGPLHRLLVRGIDADNKKSDLPVVGGVFPVLPLAAPLRSLELSNPTSTPVFYTVTQAGFDRDPPTQADKHGIEILHNLETESGAGLSSVHLGDTARVHIRLRAIDSEAAQVAVVDLLPAGFDLAPESDGSVALNGSSWTPEFVEPREDRVVFYGSVPTQVVDLFYRIKATAAGEFVVPPAQVEGMYDRTRHAHSAAAHVQVTGQP